MMKIISTKTRIHSLLLTTYYVLLTFPLFASAQTILTITELLTKVRGILDTVVPFIVGLAVFIVIWGIFTYLTHAGEEEKRAEAKKYIIWGIIGVFFMLSVWGFVNILLNTFDLEGTIDADKIPKVPQIEDDGFSGG